MSSTRLINPTFSSAMRTSATVSLRTVARRCCRMSFQSRCPCSASITTQSRPSATAISASVTEMAVALGLDWVVIDAEHGHLDWNDILQHLRATVRSDTVALVRIAELNVGLIKRVLDIGADGVVVPWVESADQLQKAVDFAHYPPDGLRGIGAERATCWGRCFTAHVDEANEHVLVVP